MFEKRGLNTKSNVSDYTINELLNFIERGKGDRMILLAQGVGCNKLMWDDLINHLQGGYRYLLFDYLGQGENTAFSDDVDQKYKSLDAYQDDIIELLDRNGYSNVIFVGHSVSATIGAMIAVKRPDLISKLIMICPSFCFLNFGDYQGGFELSEINEFMDLMGKNFYSWSEFFTPVITGGNNDPKIQKMFMDSFNQSNQIVTNWFLRAALLSDKRDVLSLIDKPTLILQSSNDTLVGSGVTDYINEHILRSKLEIIPAEGHCLHMTNPKETAACIQTFCDSI